MSEYRLSGLAAVVAIAADSVETINMTTVNSACCCWLSSGFRAHRVLGLGAEGL